MTTKPTTPWHADGEGRCHDKCEARDDSIRPPYPPCGLLRSLPFVVTGNALPEGYRCPFAVLADVLCAATPHEEPDVKPSPQDVAGLMELAWNCGCRFGRDAGGGTTVGENEQKDADIKRLLTMEECHGGAATKPTATEILYDGEVSFDGMGHATVSVAEFNRLAAAAREVGRLLEALGVKERIRASGAGLDDLIEASLPAADWLLTTDPDSVPRDVWNREMAGAHDLLLRLHADRTRLREGLERMAGAKGNATILASWPWVLSTEQATVAGRLVDGVMQIAQNLLDGKTWDGKSEKEWRVDK